MRKVVFLRVARHPLDSSSASHQTALVLQKAADGFLTIQGHAPVACSDRQRCWDLLRRAAKSLLGLRETTAVSVRLSEPPHTAISDVADIFRQPSHIVSLTLSPLPDASAVGEEERSPRRAFRDRQRLEHLQTRPQLPASQGRKKAKCSGKEMERLLSQLNDVSQCLERTQHECEEIARRCGERRVEGRKRERGGEFDCTAEDLRVERLLQVAEGLTAQIILRQQQKSPSPPGTAVSWQPPAMKKEEVDGGDKVLPDCPADVSVQPNFSRGAYVLWSPVRLDIQDRNCGHKVIGYAVYVNGILRSKVEDPIGSHSEIADLENGMEYQVQVSTLAQDSESPLSTPISYRHSSGSSQEARDPQQQRQTTKVENWLRSSQTSTVTGLKDEPVTSIRFADDHNGGSDNDTLTPAGSTHLPDDARSVGSSHTSGIVMDLAPSSPKMMAACQCHRCSIQSETTLLIGSQSLSNKDSASPSHHLPFTPSPSPVSRSYSPDHSLDNVIDEPLDLDSSPPTRGKNSTVLLVANARHRGPAAPENVRVRCKQPGYITVSWTATRRDAKGCSNGCFILGYRVYVNGSSQISVDGPMSYETTIRCPPPDTSHKLMVHVRTRSIAAESVPSSTVIYDLLLQESYSGGKVDSSLSPSSSTTLCPDEKPRPTHHRGRSPAHTVMGLETYV